MKISDPKDGVWTGQQDEELKTQLANGRSINEIALRLKRSPLAVSYMKNAAGASGPGSRRPPTSFKPLLSRSGALMA